MSTEKTRLRKRSSLLRSSKPMYAAILTSQMRVLNLNLDQKDHPPPTGFYIDHLLAGIRLTTKILNVILQMVKIKNSS
jgi:hypothetical protein